MNARQRPEVTIESVTDQATGNITHCRVIVGGESFDAKFTQSSTDLSSMIEDATGVLLTVDEVMAVTYAAREQMVRETLPIKTVLEGMPEGTAAKLNNGLHFWLESSGNLVWVECVDLNETAPDEVYPGPIEEVGEIDTDELNEVSIALREWVAAPVFEQADIDWLRAVEETSKQAMAAHSKVFSPR